MLVFDEMDDEELLDLYETTQGLLANYQAKNSDEVQARFEKMSLKLKAIKDELVARSLWEEDE